MLLVSLSFWLLHEPALSLYDPELYASCDIIEEKCQREAEKRFREKLEAEPVMPGPIYPYNPYPGGPGVAGNEIKITCEDTRGEPG